MKLKTENYKGYALKFVERMVGPNKIVYGEFPSKVTGRVMGVNGASKALVYENLKKLVDNEVKVKVL